MENISPVELEFFAEELEIEIVPLFNLPKIKLLNVFNIFQLTD